jgi:transcriptional regulator with XRE-family HTH domain
MPRAPLSAQDRNHGRRLGARLAQERITAGLTAQGLAVAAELSIDTVRGLETGRVPAPGFLTVARMAGVLGLSLDVLHVAAQGNSKPQTARRRKR